jgi:hypothetical protein
MTPQLKRYLFVEQPIGGFVVNLVLNALIAWGVFRGLTTVPMWGQQSIAGDTIATSFFLPFFTVLIATPLVLRDVRNGKATPEHVGDRFAVVRRLPRGRLKRALVLGVVVAMVASPLAIRGFAAAGVGEGIAMPAFIWVKAVYAAVLGAVLAPWIALAAFAESAVPAAASGR